MANYIIIIAIYISGFLLSKWMLIVEQKASGEPRTNGDVVIENILSLLSFVMILIIFFRTWFEKIASTGYWQKPVKVDNPIVEPKTDTQ